MSQLVERIEVYSFRSHKATILEFSPGLNILIGDSGAGKSSVLDAIALGLTGINQWTDDVGKGKEKLFLDGATGLGVALDTSIGRIERKQGKSQALTARWKKAPAVEPSGVDAIQQMIYQQLGVGAEVLLMLLDCQPISNRDPKKQAKLLLKALPAADLNTSDYLRGRKIQINSIPHLLDLIKERKETVLRDLNRALAELEKQQDTPPKHPFEGNPEPLPTLAVIQKRLKDVQAEHTAAVEKRGAAQGALNLVTAQIEKLRSQPASGRKSGLDKDGYEHLKKNRGEYDEQLRAARTHQNTRQTELQSLTMEVHKCAREQSELGGELAELQNPGTVCPTCKQPWPDHFEKQRIERTREIEANSAAVAGKAKEVVTLRDKLQKEYDEAETSFAQVTSLYNEADRKIRLYDAEEDLGLGPGSKAIPELEAEQAGHQAELAKINANILAVESRIQAGRSFEQEMIGYDAACRVHKEQKDSRAARMIKLQKEDIPAEQKVIAELEKVKEQALAAQSNLLGLMEEAYKAIPQLVPNWTTPLLTLTLEEGKVEWTVGGRPVGLLSPGQKYGFEFALRYALAKLLGLEFMALDELAPLGEGLKGQILGFLRSTGWQCFLTVATQRTPDQWAPAPADIARFHVTIADGVSKVEKAA